MTFYEMRGLNPKVLPAIVAGLALLLSGAMTAGGVTLFGAYIGFGFLPLLVLTIWPRHANSIFSLVFVFSAGLFTDWGTGGIVGQWALVFLIIWGFFRPELRSSPFSPIGLVFVWCVTCGLAVIVLTLTGWFVYGILPDFMSFARQILLASLLLPVVVLLRYLIAKRIGENEAWGT